MTHSSNNTPRTQTIRKVTHRYAVALMAVFLGGFAITACSDQGDTSRTFAGGQSPATKAKVPSTASDVRITNTRFEGSCTSAPEIRSTDDRVVGVIFSKTGASTGSHLAGLNGEAKAKAEYCYLHVGMQVPDGYEVSPTNLIIRGYGQNAGLFTAYQWRNATPPAPSDRPDYKITDKGYTFERQVTSNSGDILQEPLYNLWSPTCGTGKKDVELIVAIAPYIEDSKDGLISIDSFDLDAVGAFRACGTTEAPIAVSPDNNCGLDRGGITYLTCPNGLNCIDQAFTNRGGGRCIDPNGKAAAPAAEDEPCGGPLKTLCGQGLTCLYPDNGTCSSYMQKFGVCARPLASGAVCADRKPFYTFGNLSDKSQRYCSPLANPCEDKLVCSNNRCSSKTKANEAEPMAVADEGDQPESNPDTVSFTNSLDGDGSDSSDSAPNASDASADKSDSSDSSDPTEPNEDEDPTLVTGIPAPWQNSGAATSGFID